jgi:anti-anti-sigma factor
VDLLVRHDTVNGRDVIALDGVIDLSTLPILHDHLTRATLDRPGGQIIVDLDAVVAIDDCGLGLLLGAAGRCREGGGDLVVVTSSPRLQHRLHLTKFDHAVTVKTELD